MLNITSGSLMRHPFGGARSLLSRSDSFLSKQLTTGVRTGELALSAFSFGVLQGRFKKQGGLTLGLPVDLMAAGAFHVLALFPFASKYASHLRAFGDGALASFVTTTGYRIGERWEQGGGLIRAVSSGMFGDAKEPAGGAAIADKELAGLVRAG